MKPAAFEYHKPLSTEEALALAGQLGADAKFLAGGQSLIPMMNFRLLHPEHLIDLNGIPELAYILVESGELRIGAMTRHREVERSPIVREGWPLLSGCMRYVAHVHIRNRGTLCGSLSHADPAAELPAVMMALEASFVVKSAGATRIVRADEFFLGVLSTVLSPGELLAEIRVPALPRGTGWGFDELSRRHGDFAIAGAAALAHFGKNGRLDLVRVAFTGLGDRPIRGRLFEKMLIGKAPGDEILQGAAEEISEISPESDLHASAEYRRDVAKIMAFRAMSVAIKRARST